jgi:hypothetical protein
MNNFFEGNREGLGGLQRLILTERGFREFLDLNVERSKEWVRKGSVEVRRLQQEYAQQELSRGKLEKRRNDRYSGGGRGNRSVDDLSSPEGGIRVQSWNRAGFLKSVGKIMTDKKKNRWNNSDSNSLPSGHATSNRKTSTIKEQLGSGLKQQKIANGRKSFRDVGDNDETDEVFIRIDSVEYPLDEFPEQSRPESIMQQFKKNSKSQHLGALPHSA